MLYTFRFKILNKRRIINLRKVLFAIFILLSCNFKNTRYLPYNTEEILDKEPNDNKTTATEIKGEKTIIGFFNKKEKGEDVDYYKVFSLEQGGSYKIILTAVPGIDSKLTIFSPDNSILFIADNGTRGEAEKIWEFVLKNDFIIVKIESKIGYNEKIPYILNFMPIKIENNSEKEPNDDKKTANTILSSVTYNALISPINDVDYYKINFQNMKSNDFSIELTTYSSIDLNMSIINELQNITKFINNTSWGEKEIFPFLSISKGEVFIKVSASINNFQRKIPAYQIKIIPLKNKNGDKEICYEQEFNDTIEWATEILDSSEVWGVLFPKNDIDFFKFDLIKNAFSVNLDIEIDDNLMPKIEIYNNEFKLVDKLIKKSKSNGKNILVNSLHKGRYYIKINSENSSLSIYKLFLKVRYY